MKKLCDSKKGFLEGVTGVIAGIIGIMIMLAIAIIGTSVMMDVTNDLRDNLGPATFSRVDNETQYANASSSFNLSNQADSTSSVIITNNTVEFVENTDYLLTNVPGGLIQVNFTNILDGNNTEVGVNYTSFTGENSFGVNATSDGLEGLGNFSSNFTTVGTILGAILLIGLVVVGLGIFVGRRFG